MPPIWCAQLYSHRVVGKGGDQPAMDQATAVGVRSCEPQPDDDSLVGPLRIERLPGLGEWTPSGERLEARGDIGRCHSQLAHLTMMIVIEREATAQCTAYKVLNGISTAV